MAAYRVYKERKTYDTITVDQLAERLQVKQTKAYEIMKAIRSVSDTLGISGMCHKQDYEAWKKSRYGQGKTEKEKRE